MLVPNGLFRLWLWIRSTLYVQSLTPMCLYLGMGPLGSNYSQVWLSWWSLWRDIRELALPPPCEDTVRRWPHGNQEERALTRIYHAGTLILDFQHPELWDKVLGVIQSMVLYYGSLSRLTYALNNLEINFICALL